MVNPVEILNQARRAVPAVDYALAVAGIAAAGAIVTLFVGHGFAAVIIVGLVFVGMFLVFIFSTLVNSHTAAPRIAGIILLWVVLCFFVVFLCLIVSAFLGYGPNALAKILGIQPENRQEALVRRMDYLVEKNKGSVAKPGHSHFFSDPKLNDRNIDGCAKSSFFPPQFGLQCLAEAQKVIATIFCRSKGYTGSVSNSVETFNVMHRAYVLSLEESPGETLEIKWDPSDTSGCVFTQIECQ